MDGFVSAAGAWPAHSSAQAVAVCHACKGHLQPSALVCAARLQLAAWPLAARAACAARLGAGEGGQGNGEGLCRGVPRPQHLRTVAAHAGTRPAHRRRPAALLTLTRTSEACATSRQPLGTRGCSRVTWQML